jgi:hypothetical protein
VGLDEDDKAYAEFFAWKLELFGMFEKQLRLAADQRLSGLVGVLDAEDYCSFRESPFCTMCAKLYDSEYMNSETNREYKISEWFNPKLECWDERNKPYSRPINIFG